MGFLKPGWSLKRRPRHDLESSPRKKSRVKEPQKDSSRSTEVTAPQNTVSPLPVLASGLQVSILERFPVEIVHMIYEYSDINGLPLVSKHLNRTLRPTPSLKKKILAKHIIDLDPKGLFSGMEFKYRFVLEREILNYRFVDAQLLRDCNIDAILPLQAITPEIKNRFVLYFDKLNKRLLHTQREDSADEDRNSVLQGTSEELAQIAEDMFNGIHIREDEELSDEPIEENQDFPKPYYCGPFTQKKLELIELLHSKNLRFIDGEDVLSNAIKGKCNVEYLQRLLNCCEASFIRNTKPLIEAFEFDDFDLADWITEKLQDKDELNNDELWLYVSKRKCSKLLKFLERKGATPSHEVIGYMGLVC